MFVSDAVIFTELHKTGGTHIGHWLQKLVGGEQVGKHNRVPPHLRDRFVLGSVRNPWDWYVSLWAFGCGGEGSVRQQVTRRLDFSYCRQQLPAEMGRRWLTPAEWARQLIADWCKPVAQWQQDYHDPNDAGAFRSWLHRMMDPARSLDVGEGYGHSPVARSAGLLTYRYLKLFTSLDRDLYHNRELATPEGRWRALNTHGMVNHMIRNEQLESDLLEGLERAGLSLSSSQRQALQEGSTHRLNRSRRRDTPYYYDAASIALVAEQEALIIQRHGYEPPRLQSAC